MNTCANCSRWKQTDAGYYDGFGGCAAVPQYWESIVLDDDGNEVIADEYKDTKAFTQDASDYVSMLLTRPDFGCVMFEEQK